MAPVIAHTWGALLKKLDGCPFDHSRITDGIGDQATIGSRPSGAV